MTENQTTEPRYPDVEVALTGGDGNAFAVISKVSQALRRAKVPDAERKEFMAEAMAGDYDHLLRTCMRWVEVV